MNRCIALWHRVGGRQFRHWEVKDLVPHPVQLKAMANRGYLKVVATETVVYGKPSARFNRAIWQMTEQMVALCEVEEGIHVRGQS